MYQLLALSKHSKHQQLKKPRIKSNCKLKNMAKNSIASASYHGGNKKRGMAYVGMKGHQKKNGLQLAKKSGNSKALIVAIENK